MDNTSYYNRILSSVCGADYLSPAFQAYEKTAGGNNNALASTTSFVTAPVILSYVAWVLFDAQKRGIHRMYFLSRDGYVMYNMALKLCANWGIKMECHYFYCSRYTLTLPMYMFSREHALNTFFDQGVNITPLAVLKRAGIEGGDAISLLAKTGVEKDARLDRDGLLSLREKLENDSAFSLLAIRAASSALIGLQGYFNQEMGDAHTLKIALVDTGWGYSTQSNFCRAYKYIFSEGIKPDWYFFGAFLHNNPEFGNRHAWYLSPERDYYRYPRFNNNLFECLCSADHGMTLGYTHGENGWEPIMRRTIVDPLVTTQLLICDKYTDFFIKSNPVLVCEPDFVRAAEKLIKRLMSAPSVCEARVYGAIKFCDDPSEEHISDLAVPLTLSEYWEFSTMRAILHKLIRRQRTPPKRVQYWLDGSIALSGKTSILMKADRLLRLLLFVVLPKRINKL